MTQTDVTRLIVVNAPAERVWTALTTPEQLVRWLVPNLPDARLEREAAGHFKLFLFGEMGVDFVQLDVLELGRRGRLRGLPDDLMPITFALDAAERGTQLTVTLAGFDQLPAGARADRQAQAGAAWEKSLANCQAYVEGRPLPHPTAYVGPLFGYWREPGQKIGIERSIWIKAPRQRVWQALVDPQQLTEWFSPNTPWALSELAVGGRFFVPNAETGAEQYTTIIDLLDPPVQLVTRTPAHEYNPTEKVTSYSLAEENGGTRLTLTYTGYEHDAEAGRGPGMEQTTFGFGMMLQNVKAVVEGQPLPFPMGF